jgi:hypothetical protein
VFVAAIGVLTAGGQSRSRQHSAKQDKRQFQCRFSHRLSPPFKELQAKSAQRPARVKVQYGKALRPILVQIMV